MLFRLFGPIPLSNGYVPVPAGSNNMTAAHWVDGVGLVYPIGSSIGTLVVQADGYTVKRGNMPGAYTRHLIPDLDSPGKFYIRLYSGPTGGIYNFDPRTGIVGSVVFAHASPTAFSGVRAISSGKFWYCSNNGNLYTSAQTNGAAQTLVHSAGIFDGFIPYGGVISVYDDTTIAIAWCESGQVNLFNWRTLTGIPIAKTLEANNVGAWYSRKLGVFISLSAAGVSVWAEESQPTQFVDLDSIFGALPQGAPTEAHTAIMSTYVLDGQSMPVAGALVEWSLTGPGTLLNTTSVSDANGRATVKYLAPFASAGGTFDLTATTRF
jgi:hypothetical protein